MSIKLVLKVLCCVYKFLTLKAPITKSFTIFGSLLLLALVASPCSARNKRNCVVVTDHIKAKEWRSGDVSDALQRIIDENPNRLIYFK